MRLNLNDEQVKMMMKLAILGSVPMGMGHLHHDPFLKVEDITNLNFRENYDGKRSASVDYYQGRMVKFSGREVEPGVWEFHDEISHDYQSWKRMYKDYQALSFAALDQL